MSRRDLIRMSEEELAAFLDEQRTVVLATVGRDGWPHLMPLWYTVRDGEIWAWTYARSQKVRNLERDDRVTLQVEAGESYEQLRGVMVKARARIHRDVETVTAFGLELFARYGGGAGTALAPEVEQMVRTQAPKRVAMQFVAESAPVTWDHRKLGGVY
ncbi:pyridoxamine 5'-phosphate oxidase family protein [Conexibacter arvalis]|uniref:PPOX class probable F420-dependent enzyme n=1 Tax=Conexibacter arvalis TaxID=912552 RepID=A0A840I8G6_9ACTN|nr:pyridoxamine 5'-phosphate oxidase family protein [Conexibacter arvalis]MBB4661199.1 PPOX class probable F420-dependent enzyme [Conexibacter arvalis]